MRPVIHLPSFLKRTVGSKSFCAWKVFVYFLQMKIFMENTNQPMYVLYGPGL
jgi:hypothetical protein